MKLCECGCGKPTTIARQSIKAFGHIKGQSVRFIRGHHLRWNGTFKERFEQYFDKTPDSCWIWKAHRNKKGYGQFGVRSGCMKGAHRISYELYKGPIPKGRFVCHKCDNPPCVNPDHLYAGTVKDNVRDMVERGRSNKPIGERHHSARLTAQDVLNIREDIKNGRKQAEIARFYHVDKCTINDIKARRTWKHI